MGTETKKKIENLRNALADIKLLLQSGVLVINYLIIATRCLLVL